MKEVLQVRGGLSKLVLGYSLGVIHTTGKHLRDISNKHVKIFWQWSVEGVVEKHQVDQSIVQYNRLLGFKQSIEYSWCWHTASYFGHLSWSVSQAIAILWVEVKAVTNEKFDGGWLDHVAILWEQQYVKHLAMELEIMWSATVMKGPPEAGYSERENGIARGSDTEIAISVINESIIQDNTDQACVPRLTIHNTQVHEQYTTLSRIINTHH